MPEAALSLGSNLGDKAAAINEALRRLDGSDGVELLRHSSLYRTAPWGDTDQDWFLNACALVRTSLPPRPLLARCLAIETELGRDRTKSRRWGPRPIDIDLLFYDDLDVSEAELQLPHPHLFERAFVLVPLSEIAGERIVKGRSISGAADAADRSGISLWNSTAG